MLMLTAYLDETGHSKDLAQKFVGMGGIIAESKDWIRFEKKWKKILIKYQVPYLHMKDFAHSTNFYKEWKGNEAKRRSFYGELMQSIRLAKAMPFGCIIPMEYYRQHPEYLRNYAKNPYYLSFMLCTVMLAQLIEPFRKHNETITTVFAEQTEFQQIASRVFEAFRKDHPTGDLMEASVFKPMQHSAPLQCADLVAYELYKEADRLLYRTNAQSRWGWSQLLDIAKIRANNFLPFTFVNEQNVADYMIGTKRAHDDSILGRI